MRGMGEDQSLLRHGAGIVCRVELFVQDFDSHGEFGGFLIELAEASPLPSQPPVVKVANVALEMYEVAARSDEEGAEPSGEWFNRVFVTATGWKQLKTQRYKAKSLRRLRMSLE